MARRAAWPVVAAAMAAALPARAQLATLPLPGTEAGIVLLPGDQSEPALSSPFGSFIAYTDQARIPSEVWYCRLEGLGCSLFQVPPGSAIDARGCPPLQAPPAAADQFSPAVAGDLLVYLDEGLFGPRRGNVILLSLTDGLPPSPVSCFAAFQGSPAVSDSLVAWEDERGADRDVWVHDLLRGGEWSITGAGFQHTPRTSGTLVSYLDDAEGAVKVYDLARPAGEKTTVAYPGLAAFADVDGAAVAVQTLGGDLEVWSTDGRPLAALALPGLQANPHISGDWVAFEDSSTQVSRVIVWNWRTGDLYAPPAGTSSQTLNDISWPRVAYVDDRSQITGRKTGRDIFLYDTSVDGVDGGIDGGVDGGIDGGVDGGVDGGDDGGTDGGTDGGVDGGSPRDCDDTSVAPLAELRVLREGGGPDAVNLAFTAEAEVPALACIDARDVSSAWVLLDDEAVARPNDFSQQVVHLERRRSVVAGPNRLGAIIAGKPGSSLAVKLLPDPGGGPAPVAGAALKTPVQAAPPRPGMGCSGGAAGIASALPLGAWMLRRRRPRR
ncbi:MAG TPA: hypothetical protein VFI16_05705 [Anaeromyxobacteraceae bacterium]|nr:hypothetical protein [Anaeromyxobacteraceae bacterium]